MNIRSILGIATLAVAMLSATVVPAIGHGEPTTSTGDATPEPIVLIDTGVIVSEDGQSAMSALSVSLGN